MTLAGRKTCFLLSFLASSGAFRGPLVRPPLSQRIRQSQVYSQHDSLTIPSYSRSLISLAVSEEGGVVETVQQVQHYENIDDLNSEVHQLCRARQLEDALELIHLLEEESADCIKPEQSTYAAIMNAYARSDMEDAAERAQEILSSMKKQQGASPKGQAYSAVILAWSNSRRSDAAERADSLLSELWTLYNGTQDTAYLPTRATYAATITAWARSNHQTSAERAEELLEEIEAYYRDGYTSLGPTTACVNAVLNAWSKSHDRDAAERCEQILMRMEGLAVEGRTELQPDTVSFNTAIDAFAKSGQHGAQRRAEMLLERMETLSKGEFSFPCEPDTLSFNSVINSWAKSREGSAARRAEAILRHMEKRHEMERTNVAPDASTYNSVIHAWSKSRDLRAPQRADDVMKRMERAYANGNVKAHADSTTYNSLINVWAKSKDPRAGERALEILQLMKKLYNEEGRLDCRPDVFTYTSVIDALAKHDSADAANSAVSLLTELEDEYKRTREDCVKPNVRTYTSAINAIARSRHDPQRAEAILDRLDSLYNSGELNAQPDTVCFNAVINAWGWSGEERKSQRAYDLFQRMMEMYESGKNLRFKPDIITCNSLLNACAFETATSDADRSASVDIAIQVLEAFQAPAPKYGWPNHITFSNMLLTIGRQMPLNEKRLELAETTFWQCCEAGHVSPLVISHLRNALDAPRLQSILGSALSVNREDKFSYDMEKLPRDWRRFAPRRKAGRPSRRRTSKQQSSRSR